MSLLKSPTLYYWDNEYCKYWNGGFNYPTPHLRQSFFLLLKKIEWVYINSYGNIYTLLFLSSKIDIILITTKSLEDKFTRIILMTTSSGPISGYGTAVNAKCVTIQNYFLNTIMQVKYMITIVNIQVSGKYPSQDSNHGCNG